MSPEQIRRELATAGGARGEALFLAYELETRNVRKQSAKFPEEFAGKIASALTEMGYTSTTQFANTTFAGSGFFVKITGRTGP